MPDGFFSVCVSLYSSPITVTVLQNKDFDHSTFRFLTATKQAPVCKPCSIRGGGHLNFFSVPFETFQMYYAIF